MAVTNGWGQATQNNTNGFGKYQNTIDAGSVYADSYSGETSLVGTSAAFSYSKSSFHQDESDPTPTITGTAGGTFSATPTGLSINTSTGTIDLDNSTIQSYTITYTVSGVSSSQSLAVTASPFLVNTYSMEFDGTNYVALGGLPFLNNQTAMTVSAWVYWDGTVINQRIIMDNADNAGHFDFTLNNLGGSVSPIGLMVGIRANSSSVGYVRTSGEVFYKNGWRHLAFTYDGTQSGHVDKIKIYLDGVAQTLSTGGGTNPSQLYNSDGNGVIGAYIYSGGTTAEWDGKIDEVAIWNTALSSDAVTEIYNATNNNTGKALDLSTDTGNYTNSSSLQYWNRLGD